MAPTDPDGAVGPKIVRGRVDSLTLYEITENELQTLEEGSPSSVYLNFGIFFLSIAASFFAALLTTTPASNKVYLVFVVIVAVGFAIGTVLLVLWHRTRKQVAIVIKKIKDRCVLPPPPAPAPVTAPPSPGPTEASAG